MLDPRGVRCLRAVVASLLVLLGFVVPGVVAQAGPVAGASATCSDYSNQADAQRAGDTRDADGDGVYCEALPCPCLRPGSVPDGGSPGRPRRRAQTILARVTSVTDGDTINVRAYRPRRRGYRVRLIGIDTPETQNRVECGGADASGSMRTLAPRGLRVKLRTDPTQETTDRFGRLLAYVYAGRRQLNVTQVSRGWSSTYVYRGSRFQQHARFRRAERVARRRDRGVWGACGGDFHAPRR